MKKSGAAAGIEKERCGLPAVHAAALGIVREGSKMLELTEIVIAII